MRVFLIATQNTLTNDPQEFQHLKRNLEAMSPIKQGEQSILRTILAIMSDQKQKIADIEDDIDKFRKPGGDEAIKRQGSLVNRLGSIFQKKVTDQTKDDVSPRRNRSSNGDIEQKC